MSEQDKDAVLGKAVREYNEASKEIATLRSHLANIGTQYQHLGSALVGQAEGLSRPSEGIDVRFTSVRHPVDPGTWVGIDALLGLAHKLRELIIAEDSLARHLSQLGLNPTLEGRTGYR